MVVAVVVTNVVVGLLCLFVAWKIGQLRRTLAKVTETLLSVEQSVHNVLYPAPNAIRKGQAGTRQLRQRYQQLGLQVDRVQQMMSLLSLSQILWRRWRGEVKGGRVRGRRE